MKNWKAKMDRIIIEYAPLFIILVTFLYKNRIFVTPEVLSKTKDEILKDVRAEFATKELLKELKENINRIEANVNKILDHIMQKKD